MAYNVLKGTVEGSVDQHGDQEIGGVKVFKNTISASIFYDTDAQSPCATLKDVAIQSINEGKKASIITYEGDSKGKAHYNLTFDGKALKGTTANFDNFIGGASGLIEIPAGELTGLMSADIVKHGSSLYSDRGALEINKSDGIKITDSGVSLDLAPNGALKFENGKVKVQIDNTLDVSVSGQNISDNDTILMYDVSRGDLRHTTFKNMYDGFINLKIPHPAGTVNSVQFKGRKGLSASDNLTFDNSSNTLTIKGNSKTLCAEISQEFISNGKTEINGSLYKSIKTVSDFDYEVQDNDSTILVDITSNSSTIMLPNAKNNCGRVISIKGIIGEQQKYRIRSNNSVKIITNGELIDFTQQIILKSNYSSRTFHSDGNKWWIINANGS